MNDDTEQIEVEPVGAADGTPAEPEASSKESQAAPEQAARLVSVSEAIRYRKRAQAAERELAETKERLDEVTRQAQTAQQRLAQSDRRAAIDRGLIESGAADLEAARLLVEAALNEGEADVAGAIEGVRRQQPQMFRTISQGLNRTAAMGPAVRHAPESGRDLDRAARAARRSGHNADVMHYMNLRRSAPR